MKPHFNAVPDIKDFSHTHHHRASLSHSVGQSITHSPPYSQTAFTSPCTVAYMPSRSHNGGWRARHRLDHPQPRTASRQGCGRSYATSSRACCHPALFSRADCKPSSSNQPLNDNHVVSLCVAVPCHTVSCCAILSHATRLLTSGCMTVDTVLRVE